MQFTIRCSSLPTYADCARRMVGRSFDWLVQDAGFKLREIGANIGSATGTATHAAAAYMLQEKIDNGGLGNVTEMEQIGVQSLEESIKYGVAWDATTPNLDIGTKQVIRQSRVYRGQVAPKLTPINVEVRLEASTPSGNVLSGQTDNISEAVGTALHDLKTGVKARANMLQYGLYALLRAAHRLPTDAIVEDYIKRVGYHKEQPDAQRIEYPVDEAKRTASFVLKRLEDDLGEFQQTGNPLVFMANPASMLCSEKWCSAWGTKFCTEHAKD